LRVLHFPLECCCVHGYKREDRDNDQRKAKQARELVDVVGGNGKGRSHFFVELSVRMAGPNTPAKKFGFQFVPITETA